MHHSKELAFTLILMPILSRCTVRLIIQHNVYGPLHTTGLFSCYRIITVFESESFSTAFLKPQKKLHCIFTFCYL